MRIAILFTLLAAAAPLAGHDLSVEVEFAPPAVVVRAAYGGSDAAAGAEIKLYSPADSAEPYQSARTDSAGVFAFVPDRDGDWLLVVDDEWGHRIERSIRVEFRAGAAPRKPPAGALSLAQKLLVGLSVIFGATGILIGVKARGGAERGAGL